MTIYAYRRLAIYEYVYAITLILIGARKNPVSHAKPPRHTMAEATNAVIREYFNAFLKVN